MCASSSECLEELGCLIESYGIAVAQPSPQQAFKLIAQLEGPRSTAEFIPKRCPVCVCVFRVSGGAGVSDRVVRHRGRPAVPAAGPQADRAADQLEGPRSKAEFIPKRSPVCVRLQSVWRSWGV